MPSIIHVGPAPVTLKVEQGTAPYPPPPPGVSLEDWLAQLEKEKKDAEAQEPGKE